MYVIGTAGHIDHGKSALVKAVSGIDPDRLPEEKERGLTIDLGFAWITLPGLPADDREVGIVDVPGHERFIRNMIAGAGGIDLVILVIAADDGWMPQTEEHLRICQLLGVRRGVVAISKIDLVDPDWASLVADDVSQKLAGTFLEGAPVVQTSATTGRGLHELLDAVSAALAGLPPKPDYGRPRLFIDRAFTITGRGTVVTGTLVDGCFSVGQEVAIYPSGRRCRIRGIQSHRKSLDEAQPGSRTALNLSGIEKGELRRGDMVSTAEFDQLSSIFGLKLDLLPNGPPIRHAGHYLLLSGTCEIPGRIFLLGRKREVAAGDTHPVIFKAQGRWPILIGDRFILRRPSPALTLGGGVVVETTPFRSFYRERSGEFLRSRFSLDPAKLLDQELSRLGHVPRKTVLRNLRTGESARSEAVESLRAGNKAVHGKTLLFGRAYYDEASRRILKVLERFHENSGHLQGMKSAEMAGAVDLPENVVDEVIEVLIGRRELARSGAFIHLSRFKAGLDGEQEERGRELLRRIGEKPLANPLKKELLSEDQRFAEPLRFLISSGEVIELHGGVLLLRRDAEEIERRCRAFIEDRGRVTAAEVKEFLGTTRKYAVPLLEHFDEIGLTVRDGDFRRLADR